MEASVNRLPSRVRIIWKMPVADLPPKTDLINNSRNDVLNSTQSNAFVIPGTTFLFTLISEMIIQNEDMLLGLPCSWGPHLTFAIWAPNKTFGWRTTKDTYDAWSRNTAALAGAARMLQPLWLGGIANQAENTLTYRPQPKLEAASTRPEYLNMQDLPPGGYERKLFKAFFKKQALGRPKRV